jgi:hypothetical protein
MDKKTEERKTHHDVGQPHGEQPSADDWRGAGKHRAFELFDKTARIEIRQAWPQGSWKGVIDGTPRLQGDLSRNVSLGEGWDPTANGERRTAGVVVTMQFKYNGGDHR